VRWMPGVVAGWVAGDEVCGADPMLSAALQARGLGYVLAVACDHRVPAGGDPYRADALAARVPAGAWQCISARRGAKGYRLYDWAFVQLDHCDGDPADRHWLLIRHRLHRRRTGLLPLLDASARAAGHPGPRRRMPLADRGAFQASKGLCGLG
jgi:hypothetical protein